MRKISLEVFSVEAAVQDPVVRLSVRGVYRRSPPKIFARDLQVKSLLKLSIKNLRARPLYSLHQVSVPNLYKSSPGKISVQALYHSSVGKISVRNLSARSLYRSPIWSLGKTSGQDLYMQEISCQDLCMRSLYKLSIKALLARFV